MIKTRVRIQPLRRTYVRAARQLTIGSHTTGQQVMLSSTLMHRIRVRIQPLRQTFVTTAKQSAIGSHTTGQRVMQ